MLAAAVIAGRLMQFAGAVVLLGSPLFLLYGLPAGRGFWPRGTRAALLGAAAALALGAVLSLLAQTATIAGAPAAAFDRAQVSDVASSTRFGLLTAARIALALGAGVLLLAFRPSRGLWRALLPVAGLILASFAWSGHGSIGEGAAGWAHLVGDLLHLFAAAVWLGALGVLAALLLSPPSTGAERTLHGALEAFSRIGLWVVLVLLASGLVNSWALVGLDHVASLLTDPYGLLLLAKVVLFLLMLGLAALNRFRLTPRLALAIDQGAAPATALGALRRSILLEGLAGLLVLAAVGALGVLAPPASQ